LFPPPPFIAALTFSSNHVSPAVFAAAVFAPFAAALTTTTVTTIRALTTPATSRRL